MPHCAQKFLDFMPHCDETFAGTSREAGSSTSDNNDHWEKLDNLKTKAMQTMVESGEVHEL